MIFLPHTLTFFIFFFIDLKKYYYYYYLYITDNIIIDVVYIIIGNINIIFQILCLFIQIWSLFFSGTPFFPYSLLCISSLSPSKPLAEDLV